MTENKKASSNLEIRQSGYKFISPLLECKQNGSAILKSSELKIKKRIQDEILNENPDIFISLYFRDLNNGPSFGINEQEDFSPASLLKVPLMIAYYKKPTSEFQQKISPQKHIELGKDYLVEELIEAMIRYSDNEATNLLFQNMDKNDLQKIFTDLGIIMPNIYDPNNAMPVKDYASFFRILFNASYLFYQEICQKRRLNFFQQ